MHTGAHSHPHLFGTKPGPANLVVTLLVVLLFFIFLLLFLTLVAGTAQAQTAVPPTARQAASMPQFASRLVPMEQPRQNASRVAAVAHSGSPQRSRLQACAPTKAGWMAGYDDILYSNGPVNGSTDAWTINYGWVVADSFPVSAASAVSGMTFAAWLFPGDVLRSVEISITSEPFGGTSYFDQVVSLTQSACSGNQYGFNVCTESGNFTGPNLAAGAYWVNLQNAVVNSGDPVYWDENSGPSLAEETQTGTIPSEAFTILGSPNPPSNSCMPEQSGSFKVIHDFTGGGDGGGPSGVALDRAGNVYGAASGGQQNGTVYKMAQAASGWVLSTLYDFLGGANGSSPNDVIVGPNGMLYGSAFGGTQNCGQGYCGMIFQLRPEPTPCMATSCSWMENAVYAFNGPPDAFFGNGLVSDRAGNLYGVGAGGAFQQGAVFELTPTIGGWTETILYSFPGGSGGSGPTGVLVGNDGNLYGMTLFGGQYGAGIVYQLSPSPSGWTETVLYNPNGTYFAPPPLVQDRKGNLFGEYYYTTCCANEYGIIFELSPSSGQWVYSELWRGNPYQFDYQLVETLATDSAGNVYATGQASSGGCINPVSYGFILEFIPTNGGWDEYQRAFWGLTYFPASGSLGVDAEGNLYGTTDSCGAHGWGTVWQLSP